MGRGGTGLSQRLVMAAAGCSLGRQSCVCRVSASKCGGDETGMTSLAGGCSCAPCSARLLTPSPGLPPLVLPPPQTRAARTPSARHRWWPQRSRSCAPPAPTSSWVSVLPWTPHATCCRLCCAGYVEGCTGLDCPAGGWHSVANSLPCRLACSGRAAALHSVLAGVQPAGGGAAAAHPRRAALPAPALLAAPGGHVRGHVRR